MDGSNSGSIMGGIVGLIVCLAIGLVIVASIWKVFAKAGQPGWAAIVPIYNIIVLLNIVGKPLWWIILFMIPLVNIYAAFVVMTGLAKSFGKSTGFGLGLMFLGVFFFPILGFGSASYIGPQA
jgi:Family of unknown function (DUF5684)